MWKKLFKSSKPPAPKRLIFLDIDEVMNSVDYMKQCAAEGSTEYRGATRLPLDPKAVALLDELIQRSGANVVITSVNRKRLSLEQMVGKFLAKGMSEESCQRFVGITPMFHESRCRGREIDEYLSYYPSYESFVILDDSNDLDPHLTKWVKVCGEHGLQRQDIEKALQILDL